MRAGFVPFLISPRNSAVAVAHLLADTGTCHILLGHDQPIQDLASEALNILRNDSKYKTLHALPDVSLVPLFDDIYRPVDEPFELLPPSKPDPRSLAVIVHSSGSLGLTASFSTERKVITVCVMQDQRRFQSQFPGHIWASLCMALFLVSAMHYLPRVLLLNIPYALPSDFGDRDMAGVKLSCHVSSHSCEPFATLIILSGCTTGNPNVPRHGRHADWLDGASLEDSRYNLSKIIVHALYRRRLDSQLLPQSRAHLLCLSPLIMSSRAPSTRKPTSYFAHRFLLRSVCVFRIRISDSLTEGLE